MERENDERLVRSCVWFEGRRESSWNVLFALPGGLGHIFQMVTILFASESEWLWSTGEGQQAHHLAGLTSPGSDTACLTLGGHWTAEGLSFAHQENGDWICALPGAKPERFKHRKLLSLCRTQMRLFRGNSWRMKRWARSAFLSHLHFAGTHPSKKPLD